MNPTFYEIPCPRCGRSIRVFPSDSLPPQCDAPRCLYEFPAIPRERELPAREGEAPAPHVSRVPKRPPAPPVGNPRLVAPHACPACTVPITEPAGMRRRTIDHACGNRTDLFAVLFRSPCCCAYLELPLAHAGREVDCPACPRRFRGPRDDILHRLSGDIRSGQLMAFICPNDECRSPLQANTHVNGEPVSGQPVVCPVCLSVFAMPSAGAAVRPAP